MDIKKLIAVETGEIHHINNGLRPDFQTSWDSRDGECPACKILTDAVAELEAERTEREPIAWYCDGDDGREYNGCPQMSNGRTGIPLYATPPVTTPVRLTDTDFNRLYDEAGFDPNEMREAAEHMFNAIQSAVLRANGFKVEGEQ